MVLLSTICDQSNLQYLPCKGKKQNIYFSEYCEWPHKLQFSSAIAHIKVHKFQMMRINGQFGIREGLKKKAGPHTVKILVQ